MIGWCLQVAALGAFLWWSRTDHAPQPSTHDESLEAAIRRLGQAHGEASERTR